MCLVSRVFSRLLLLLVLLLALPVIAGERGLLWKVQPAQGAPSYLFGTIHTHDARVTNFSPQLLKAIDSAEVFMPEAMPPADPAMMFMARGTLKDLLSPQETEVLLRLADAYALRDSIALRMKPWLLAVVLAQPSASGLLFQDLQLMEIANGKGKTVEALEQPEAHFGAMDSLEMSEQLALLRATMKQSQEEKEQDFETLIKAYLTRDVENIAALDEKLSSSGLPSGLWPKIRKMLIEERNARMAERLVARMQQNSAFVAVGAAHLPGTDGLVARLRAAGFKVEAVE
jgi:uncharacterized protein YbaP (TraB family)